MDGIIKDIIITALGLIVSGVMGFVGFEVKKFINSKIKNEETKKKFNTAFEIINSSVKQTYQTYVESIKGTSFWTTEAQKEALNKALKTSESLLTDDVKDCIKENFGDLTTWLTNKIEAKIFDLKNINNVAEINTGINIE